MYKWLKEEKRVKVNTMPDIAKIFNKTFTEKQCSMVYAMVNLTAGWKALAKSLMPTKTLRSIYKINIILQTLNQIDVFTAFSQQRYSNYSSIDNYTSQFSFG